MNAWPMRTLGVALTLALAAPALAGGKVVAPQKSDDGIAPTVVYGNPDCEDLGYEKGYKPQDSYGDFDSGYETFEFPDLYGKYITVDSDDVYFDWDSDVAIDAVIVKAGTNSHLFKLTNSYDDGNMSGPLNTKTYKPYGISHIEFCYHEDPEPKDLEVSKTAYTSFTRTYWWDITKVAYPTWLGLDVGEHGYIDYDVTVTPYAVDSGWEVEGTITITNPDSYYDAEITDVVDVVGGTTAAYVDCDVYFPYTLGAGETLYCSYYADLYSGASVVNEVTVTTCGEVGGGTATADVIFGYPTVEIDDCVGVDDSLHGWLGEACDVAKTFSYTEDVSYYTCGEYEVYNEASFTTYDTWQYGSADATVYVDVACEPPPPPPEDCPNGYGDLGSANPYNVFVLEDFDGYNSDIQGKAAIGGNGTFENYGIGSALYGAGTVLSVGGHFDATNAQVYGGDAEATSCWTSSFGIPSGSLYCPDAYVFDAGDHAYEMQSISAYLAALYANGTTTTYEWGSVTFKGTDAHLNVFEIDLDTLGFASWVYLNQINGVTIDVPYGSTVVINVVGGTGPIFKNGAFTLIGAEKSKIIWNFPEAYSLDVQNVSVPGAILAPWASVNHNSANIEGTLVAKYAYGYGQYHNYVFNGDICKDDEYYYPY